MSWRSNYLSAIISALAVLMSTTSAMAKLPRGAVLSADDQSGDVASGSTIARGNAELSIGEYAITGKADVIELWPKRNEVVFKGRANVSVGQAKYEGDTIVCSLDFDRCLMEDIPASDEAEPFRQEPVNQTGVFAAVPVPAPATATVSPAAATTPR